MEETVTVSDTFGDVTGFENAIEMLISATRDRHDISEIVRVNATQKGTGDWQVTITAELNG